MIELWSREQIDAVLTKERIDKIKYEAAKHPMPKGMAITLDDDVQATILDTTSIEPSAIRIVVRVAGLDAAINYSKTSGTKVEQVFRKTRTITVVEYVTAKDL